MRIHFTSICRALLVPAFLCLFLVVNAQDATVNISGKILAAEGRTTLQGASVKIRETNKGVLADQSGNFTIRAVKGQTIEVSFLGYETQTFKIDGPKTLIVMLLPATNELDQVVVVGYGTQKKSHLTGAVAKMNTEKLADSPVARLDQAMQGKIAGVQVQNTSPEAGSASKIRIRGVSSINAGADPLVVVDGHPVPDGLAYLNNSDVESVEVLKDAASAAIYGSRGASGIILITTKSGKVDKPKYAVKYSSGIRSAYETYPMMTVTEYTQMLFNEAALKATDPSITAPIGTGIAANNERAAYVIEQTIFGGVPTNWQQEALRNAVVSNVQVNASGGTKGMQYFVSGGYQNDQGMMDHSEFEKYNLRSKLDINLNKRTRLSFNVNPSFTKRERPSVNFIDFVRFQSYLPVYHTEGSAAFVNQVAQWAGVRQGDFAQARHFNGRIYSGTMPDGSTWVNTAAVDPFATANNTPKSIMETRTINSNEYRMQSAADLTVNILPGFDLKVLGGSYFNYSNGLDYAKRNSSSDGGVNRGQYNNRLYVDLLSENTLTYNKKFNKHNINLLAGFTSQTTSIKEEQTVGTDYPSDNITTLNTALTVDKANTFNTKNKIGLLSYLGRANYNYSDKYLLSASFRADGSSYFAKGNKWGYFPSLSLGWVVTEEKFMQKMDWLSRLKLRGSYGATGNNRIVDFAFVDLLYASNYPFGAGTGTTATGQAPSTTILSNPNITWERTFSYNVGLDVAVLNNRIGLSIDAYQSKTDRLLLQQATLAFAGVPLSWNNIGSLQNRGLEFELTSNNVASKNLKWNTSANISFNRNKIRELGTEAFLINQGERTELYLNRPGNPLIQFFGYKTDGVWLSQTQINEAKAAGLTSALSNVFVPGGLKLVDVNGDKIIDDKDRVVNGNPYPDFTWGLSNNFSYKAFDLGITIQGVQGGELVNGDANYNETKRYNKNYNQNRWLSPANIGDGNTPYSTVGFNWMLTDYVVESASYQAVREVILGYKLPKAISSKLKLVNLRIYTSIQNLYLHSASGYRGINTEARFNTGPYATSLVDGYQRGSFPMPRTFMFGLDVNF